MRSPFERYATPPLARRAGTPHKCLANVEERCMESPDRNSQSKYAGSYAGVWKRMPPDAGYVLGFSRRSLGVFRQYSARGV